jgi:hypothetical protein
VGRLPRPGQVLTLLCCVERWLPLVGRSYRPGVGVWLRGEILRVRSRKTRDHVPVPQTASSCHTLATPTK